MKTTILMLAMLTTTAVADVLDPNFGTMPPLPTLEQTRDPLYYPPTPPLPSMVDRYYPTRPASDAGYNFMSPTQTCHSDGQNTFCFPR